MVRAMLCATHDRTSDAETSRRTRVDSDWKAAMGVDDWFEGIGATTFSLMRARMVAHDADGALFQKTLERAVERGIFKQPLTAVIDSSPVHGAGAVASTYELVRKMMGRLARALGANLDAALAAKVAALAAAKPDIDWQDPAARKDHLGELVELAATLLGSAAANKELMARAEVAEAAGLLSQVVLQDVEATDDGLAVRQGVAPDRVVSHSDPEMRHGRKSASRRFDGHKLDVMVDEASEMVLGVEVRAGNAGDGEGAAPLLSKVTGTEGIEVATLLADMAYSDGDVREAVEAEGTELVAKVPPVTNSGRFPKTEFNIDLAAGTVTCPAGQATSDARRAKDHKGRPATMFYFDARTCEICPLRERCTGRQRRPHHHGRTPPPPHRGGPGRPGPAGDQGIVAPAGQSGTKNRPPPGPRYAQSPLPGPAQDPPASFSGRHRRQLQALGCARRAPPSFPRRRVSPWRVTGSPAAAGTGCQNPPQPLTPPLSGTITAIGTGQEGRPQCAGPHLKSGLCCSLT